MAKPPTPHNFTRQQVTEGASATSGRTRVQVWGGWTWIRFKRRPNVATLQALNDQAKPADERLLCGACWLFSGKHTWYTKQVIGPQEVIAALTMFLDAGNVKQRAQTCQKPSEQTTEPEPPKAAGAISRFSPLFHESLARKLKQLGDKMQAEIDHQYHPGVANQRPTRRRADTATRMAREAARLERIQGALYALSAGQERLARGEQSSLSELLWYVESKALVEDLLSGWSRATDPQTAKRLKRARIAPDQFEVAKGQVTALVSNAGRQDPTTQQIKQLERDLIGVRIPGYFPTPCELARRLAQIAAIQPGMDVLEPSAGKGNIAEAIRELVPEANLYVIEYQQGLREILRLKGFDLIWHDFTTFGENGCIARPFDRVLMNPPFEKWQGHWQDIQHVRRAYELLKPGGKLVAIMSAGALQREDHETLAFRAWFEQVGDWAERLPDGSFSQGERATEVSTSLVVITKPEENGGEWTEKAVRPGGRVKH